MQKFEVLIKLNDLLIVLNKFAANFLQSADALLFIDMLIAFLTVICYQLLVVNNYIVLVPPIILIMISLGTAPI